MLIAVANGWWLVMLRGAAGVCFGLAAYTEPGITLPTLAFLYGCYALIDGALAILAAIQAYWADAHWGVVLVEGTVAMCSGLVAVPWPGMTVRGLTSAILIRAIVTGLAQLITARRLRTRTGVEWLPALGGLASLAFIMAAVSAPERTLELALWSGGCALISGPLQIVFGHWLRTWIRSNNLGDYIPTRTLNTPRSPATSHEGGGQ